MSEVEELKVHIELRREEADSRSVSQPGVDLTEGRDSGWYGLCVQRQFLALHGLFG